MVMSFWKKLVDFFSGPAVEVVEPQPMPSSIPAPISSPDGSDVPLTPQPPPPDAPNPYDAGGLLTLSPEELRAKAVKIQPWRTEWIGRTDVIPPQDDERTGLIDRGLMLGGYISAPELREIHEVGDLWLEHREADKLARSRMAKSVDDAINALRQEAARRKLEKQRQAAERREQRAEEVAKRHATDIIFLGRGVSGRLHDRRSHVESLEAADLPVLATPADVATALGLSISVLRWLCFHSEAAKATHYTQFEIPKRRGGVRVLAAPKRRVKAAQQWVLDNILSKIAVHEAAHGFVPGRSTVTNAKIHQGQLLVIAIDLQDFFPTITVHRVRGLFQSFGYSPAAASVLALLCTESPRRPMSYDGTRYMVAVGDRALPQGACTSPALSNLVTRHLDRRLSGLAKTLDLEYSRYADDLTFSSSRVDGLNIGRFLAKTRHIIEDEGFSVNPDKIHVQRSGGRRSVTGITVNRDDKLTIPRAEVRKLKAILHNAERTGLEAQNRDHRPDFAAHLQGKLAYLSMIDPERARPLIEQLSKIMAR